MQSDDLGTRAQHQMKSIAEHDLRARLDDDSAVELRVGQLAFAARLDRVEDQAICLEHVLEAP